MEDYKTKQQRLSLITSSNGDEISSPAEKATQINEIFENFNIQNPPLTCSADIISLAPSKCPKNLLRSEDDVLEIILSLDIKKTSGLDGISVRMLKETVATISPILCTLFNLSIKTGVAPDSWKTSMITPFLSRATCQIQKIIVQFPYFLLLVKSLNALFLKKLCLQLNISNQQWGFLPWRSTTGAILSTIHSWHYELEKGAEIATNCLF